MKPEWKNRIAFHEAVASEFARVEHLNRFALRENSDIARRNNLIAKKNADPDCVTMPLEKFVHLPYREAGWAIAYRADELRNRSALGARSPGVWREMIDTLEEPLRNRVATVIWWDFFGTRPTRTKWPHLDDIIDATWDDSPTDDEVIQGLIDMGYSVYRAWDRIARNSLTRSTRTYKWRYAKPVNKTLLNA